MSTRYQCAKYVFLTFVKMALIKNNYIYISANLSAIFGGGRSHLIPGDLVAE